MVANSRQPHLAHGPRGGSRPGKREPFVYITDTEALASFCARAAGTKVLAVDTEFIRERTFYPKLCLVQVATGEESAVVDPLLVGDLAPLAALLADPGVTKIFHACSQDLEAIWHAMGVRAAPLFDTQLAAAFLGHRMQIGYGPLVEAMCGVHLPKAESLTDWSRRPLDAEQLRYAEDDVTYLPRIYGMMMDELVARDRLSWVSPEMEALADPSHLALGPRDAYLHLKRVGNLTRRQLAVAREACAWRDEMAQRADVPRRWVLSDEVMLEACKRSPRTVDRLRRIRGTERLSDRDAQALVEAIGRGMDCLPDQLPERQHRMRPPAEAESVIDLMYALLRLVSERSGVAAQLIATRDDLYEFMLRPQSSPLSQGWRYDLAGRQLSRLLAGETGITVRDGHLELL